MPALTATPFTLAAIMKKSFTTTILLLSLFVGSGQSTINLAKPVLFETAFSNDSNLIDSTVLGRFIKFRLGSLKIESGSLVISDPVHMHHASVIPYTFPKGNFPVEVTVNYIDSSDLDDLSYVSYSRILFSHQSVAKWVLIFDASKDSISTKGSHYTAWTESCVILDKKARQTYISRPYVEWAKLFVDSLNDSRRFRKWKFHKFNDHNLLAYSGFDSNIYKLYVGLDARGKIARLLVDGGMYFLPSTSF